MYMMYNQMLFYYCYMCYNRLDKCTRKLDKNYTIRLM